MRPFFIGVSLLALIGTVPLAAQEAEEALPGDAGDSPAAEAQDAVDADPASRAAEIDELEPGVPTQVLTAEARPASASSAVMDELDLGTSEITGNQELPKVLYIVPWRESDPGDLMGPPANTLLDDVLAPIDRGEFVREVDYYRDLFEETEEQ